MSDNKVVKSQVDESQNKLLRKASKIGDVYGVKNCIEFEALKDGVFIHADVNSRSKNGKTALYLASANGHVEIVYFLLKNGADPNICDVDDTSPLMVAEWKKYTEIVVLLLLYGADTSLQNIDGGRAHVCLNEDLQRLFTLLFEDARREIKDIEQGNTGPLVILNEDTHNNVNKHREELKHKLEEIYCRNENEPHKRIKEEH